MSNDSPVASRRAGLAGAAALLLSSLSRTAAAGAAAVPPPCCGNGPPKVPVYGLGITVTPIDGNGQNVQFDNSSSAPPLAGPVAGGPYFVFVPERGVMATAYVDTNGVSYPPIEFLHVKGYTGVAFLVQLGFTLDLMWPAEVTTVYSTRPLGKGE